MSNFTLNFTKRSFRFHRSFRETLRFWKLQNFEVLPKFVFRQVFILAKIFVIENCYCKIISRKARKKSLFVKIRKRTLSFQPYREKPYRGTKLIKGFTISKKLYLFAVVSSDTVSNNARDTSLFVFSKYCIGF
jgi:hypothetical protein